jgi:hypothetical protein
VRPRPNTGRIKASSGLEGVVLHLVGPGEGSTISALGSTYTTKTDGEATGGTYSLVEEELWGDSTPLHLHTREEEAFYVLSARTCEESGAAQPSDRHQP